MHAAPFSAMFVALIAVVGPLIGLPCCVQRRAAVAGGERGADARRTRSSQRVDARDAVERVASCCSSAAPGRWRRSGTSGSSPRGARPRSRRRTTGRPPRSARSSCRSSSGSTSTRPSVDEMAVPAAPTARHAAAGQARDAVQRLRAGVPAAFQVVPSVVKRTTAAPPATAPTAAHAFAWKHEMALRSVVRPARLRRARSGRRSSS